MAGMKRLYSFFLVDISWMILRIGTAKPGLYTHKVSTGFGPQAQVIKMREFKGEGLVMFGAFDAYHPGI